jgi:hypothetical protein
MSLLALKSLEKGLAEPHWFGKSEATLQGLCQRLCDNCLPYRREMYRRMRLQEPRSSPKYVTALSSMSAYRFGGVVTRDTSSYNAMLTSGDIAARIQSDL